MLSIGEIEQRGKVVTLKDCHDSSERECLAVLSKNKSLAGETTDWCYFIAVQDDDQFQLEAGREYEVDGYVVSAQEASSIGSTWLIRLVGTGEAPEN